MHKYTHTHAYTGTWRHAHSLAQHKEAVYLLFLCFPPPKLFTLSNTCTKHCRHLNTGPLHLHTRGGAKPINSSWLRCIGNSIYNLPPAVWTINTLVRGPYSHTGREGGEEHVSEYEDNVETNPDCIPECEDELKSAAWRAQQHTYILVFILNGFPPHEWTLATNTMKMVPGTWIAVSHVQDIMSSFQLLILYSVPLRLPLELMLSYKSLQVAQLI